ncbi:uncharacterized protein BJ171DRAFT_578656 [Polychytrium aggregatum]|uniref:uncharacterized protein n=1 Tax=Polychytrium aggregatum TaxID=110093 RepID=UPI0022FEE830|nr:uncharacterized protein BJ171DRAFT_578656 [Polychytrium aggregatum]KAI9207542.1 hypothetical protein BJ171DRAFT_578656 [Polychytrium aggregatum]
MPSTDQLYDASDPARREGLIDSAAASAVTLSTSSVSGDPARDSSSLVSVQSLQKSTDASSVDSNRLGSTSESSTRRFLSRSPSTKREAVREAPREPLPASASLVGVSYPVALSDSTVVVEEIVKLDEATGLPLAPLKENIEFHTAFPAIDLTFSLLNHYSCAIHKDVLIQGRLWISQHCISFKGWTNLSVTINFDEIVHMEKKTIAYAFPNSILIETESTQYFFASFLARDEVFDILSRLWDVHVPTTSALRKYPDMSALVCVCNGVGVCEACFIRKRVEREEQAQQVQLAKKAKSKAVKPNSGYLSSQWETGSEDESGARTGKQWKSSLGIKRRKPRNGTTSDLDRSQSELDRVYLAPPASSSSVRIANISSEAVSALSVEEPASVPVEEPSTPPANLPAAPVQCPCDAQRGIVDVLDKVYDIPFDRIFALLLTFPPKAQGNSFVLNLLEKRNFTDVQVSPWGPNGAQAPTEAGPNIGGGNFEPSPDSLQVGDSHRLNYVIPLGLPIGPKTTQCTNSFKILAIRPHHYVCVHQITETPNVPAGNCFRNHLRICLTFQTPKRTRLVVTGRCEFYKSSMLKGTIEKSTADGWRGHYADLDLMLLEQATQFQSSHHNQLVHSDGELARPHQYQHQHQHQHKHSHSRHGAAIQDETGSLPQLKQAASSSTLGTLRRQRSKVLDEEPSWLDQLLPDTLDALGPQAVILLLAFLLLFLVLLITINTAVLWKVAEMVRRFDRRVGVLESRLQTVLELLNQAQP